MNKKVSTLDNNKDKGFINLHFLQKMNCQKTEWDQARLSSLVKRFAVTKELGGIYKQTNRNTDITYYRPKRSRGLLSDDMQTFA